MAIDYPVGEARPFYHLTPEMVLKSFESLGLVPSGRSLFLNSLENRVIEVELAKPIAYPSYGHREDETEIKSIVAKFYRPFRWSMETILEEHKFCQRLRAAQIPVTHPLNIDGQTLFQVPPSFFNNNLSSMGEVKPIPFYFALFPKEKGLLVDEPTLEQLKIVGFNLARLHEVGESFECHQRPLFNVANYANFGLNNILQFEHLPMSEKGRIQKLGGNLVSVIEKCFHLFSHKMQTIHGDLHYGNILWVDGKMVFTDFDDMAVGPVTQDIWMLSQLGSEQEILRKEAILEGYESYRPFPRETLKLNLALKALRYLNYLGWVCKRWEDPIFQQTFESYETLHFWETACNDFNLAFKQIEFLVSNEVANSGSETRSIQEGDLEDQDNIGQNWQPPEE